MPSFCRNCGAPLTGAFCTKCGQPAAAGQPAQAVQPTQAPSATASPQPPPAVQPAAVAAKKSSGLGKVLLIAAGVLLALFVIGAAGVWYSVHWVKNKVSTYTGGAVGGSPQQVAVDHQK